MSGLCIITVLTRKAISKYKKRRLMSLYRKWSPLKPPALSECLGRHGRSSKTMRLLPIFNKREELRHFPISTIDWENGRYGQTV